MVLPLAAEHDVAVGGGRRASNRRLVRDAILEAALDLFAEDGFDRTTVPAIARRAGVSPATVARHFPTKESLLFPESGLRAAALRQAILDRPAGEAPFAAVVAAVLAQPPLAGVALDRLARTRLAIARSTVLRGRAASMLIDWRDAVASALVEGHGVPAGDARVLAAAVAAVLDDVADRWAVAGATGDLGDDIRRAFDALRRSWKRTA